MINFTAKVDGNEDDVHAKIAKQCKHGIVEIGVLYGDTSALLCKNSNVPVYGIDPIIPDSMKKTLIGNLDVIKSKTQAFSYYTFIQDYSWNIATSFSFPFDYLFLDGDHQYESVLRDFNEWFPKLMIGGHIAFHDSCMYRGGAPYWPGPSKVADSCLTDPRLEYIESVYSLTVFKKLKD